MTTEDFVRNFKIEKDRLLADYLSQSLQSSVGGHINSLGLNTEQSETMQKLLDEVLTDAFYTILLGLDGCAGIGDMKQQDFQIQSEDGSDVCRGDGEVEGLAYKYFRQELT